MTDQADKDINILKSDSDDNDHSSIYSTLPVNRESYDLIVFFIGELQQHIEKMSVSLHSNNLRDLSHHLHQIKGAGGSFGFQILTDAAERAEQVLEEKSARDSDRVKAVDSLICLCKRVKAPPVSE
ncbi:Hpt domain protein [Poriferisphaera corsica]|uniref:Hpt domain protein n=1 Tax=Poriferisphaera corsica TaxID=2528020 RepID=A0A517YPI3_9BACT|nr:Hpt domain-containing protein [Poriferisphaera corsica]QDU32112.1 Hpt domain protein [Poriferisphaera corsica]